MVAGSCLAAAAAAVASCRCSRAGVGPCDRIVACGLAFPAGCTYAACCACLLARKPGALGRQTSSCWLVAWLICCPPTTSNRTHGPLCLWSTHLRQMSRLGHY